MAEGKADTLAALRQALQQPIRRASDPGRAKLQLATLYYCSKAVGTAEAAQILLLGGHVYEAWVLIRSLYQLTVDFLWLSQEPIVRALLFYDGLAVALEEEGKRYQRLGVLPPGLEARSESNRAHAARAAHQFTNDRGRVRPHWAEGTLRDRADAVGKTDMQLKPLADWYDLLYKKLSDFEHSGPALAFQYVDSSGDHLRAKSRPTVDQARAKQLGSLLGLLVGLMLRAGVDLGVLSRGALTATPTGN